MKLIVLGTGVVAATGLSMALFGTGVAAADDYAGQTYADASSAAGDAGLTPVIVTRSGGVLPDGDCIVERSQTSSFFDSSWTNPGGKVLFYSELQPGRRFRRYCGQLGSQPGRPCRTGQGGGGGCEAEGRGAGGPGTKPERRTARHQQRARCPRRVAVLPGNGSVNRWRPGSAACPRNSR